MSGLPLPGIIVASAIQWNEDYAVTAAHTPFIVGRKYTCSTGCDLVFIKRKAKGPIPLWRDAVPGEKVISAGTSMAYFTIYGKGTAADTRILIHNKHVPKPLATHSAPITMGMSGGPVYGTDGKVLGMTIAIGLGNRVFYGEQGPYSAAHLPRISLYTPYDHILEEWSIFQQTLNEEKTLL